MDDVRARLGREAGESKTIEDQYELMMMMVMEMVVVFAIVQKGGEV